MRRRVVGRPSNGGPGVTSAGATSTLRTVAWNGPGSPSAGLTKSAVTSSRAARAATEVFRSTSHPPLSPRRSVFAVVLGKVPVSRSQRAVPPRDRHGSPDRARPLAGRGDALAGLGQDVAEDRRGGREWDGLRGERGGQHGGGRFRARPIFACGPRTGPVRQWPVMLVGPEPVLLPTPSELRRALHRASRRATPTPWPGSSESPPPGARRGDGGVPRGGRHGRTSRRGPSSGSRGPGSRSPGRTIVDDAAVWSFPCLVVVPPGAPRPTSSPGTLRSSRSRSFASPRTRPSSGCGSSACSCSTGAGPRPRPSSTTSPSSSTRERSTGS